MSELVPRLYRARWLQARLSGEVRSYVRDDAGDDGPERAGPDDADLEWAGHLEAGPGGHDRAELTDEEGDRQVFGGSSGETPFGGLLDPSPLLGRFDLTVSGETEHAGRAAWVVTGRPRPVGTGPGAGSARGPRRRDRRLRALVDAELGILLRCVRTGPGDAADIAEFTSLRVFPGDPVATDPAALTDDEVRLLYGAGLRPLRLAAEVRERADPGPDLRRAREFLAGTNLGGRTRRLWEPVLAQPPAPAADYAGQLVVDLPARYRIDITTEPGRRPAHVVCDGRRLWRAYADRVAVRAAEPPPRALARTLDAAWLLDGFEVSAKGPETIAGRAALRLTVVPSGSQPALSAGLLSRLPAISDRAELAVDLELGIVLRQAWYAADEPVVITELRDVTTDIDPDAFRYAPPPGVRVVTGGPLAESGLTPADAAWKLAKGAGQLAGVIGRH